MYEAFYGLTCKPFQLSPDPSFYFGSTPHRKAMSYLQYGLHQGEGFVVVTGDAGTGKTTLARSLLKELDGGQVVAATLVGTQFAAQDVLRAVATAFGIPIQNADRSELPVELEIFLTSVAREGRRCLLIVDEAQNLTPQAVEELRLLSNVQLDKHALLQCFLIGHGELRHLLQSPAMRQRVVAACHMGPLDANETREYIQHRLTRAGMTDGIEFQPDVYARVFEASAGNARRINSLCDRLLLSGFLAGKRVFTGIDVAAVVAERDDELRVSERTAGTEDSAAPRGDDWKETLYRIELRLQRLQTSASECAAHLARLAERLEAGGEQPVTAKRPAPAFPDFQKPASSRRT